MKSPDVKSAILIDDFSGLIVGADDAPCDPPAEAAPALLGVPAAAATSVVVDGVGDPLLPLEHAESASRAETVTHVASVLGRKL
jgi:hypothetical protein